MIPGAQIPGERYQPLAQEIQLQMKDKARVWVGVTKVSKEKLLGMFGSENYARNRTSINK